MKLVARAVLAAAVVVSFGVLTAPAASANDCSSPKQPCGGCSLNLSSDDPLDWVECYPT